MKHPTLSWRQRVYSWTPIVFMTVLAAGTWWLVRQNAAPPAATPTTALKHEPDYEMQHFSVQRYLADGSVLAHIKGNKLRHYPDTAMLEIDQIRIQVTNPNGQTTEGTAERALANETGTQVDLLGHAQVTAQAPSHSGQAPMQLHSEHLRAFLKEDRVTAEQPVTITQGATTMHSERMAYTRRNNEVVFSGQTRASLSPSVRP